jgi:hypothetical protein
MWIGHEHSCQRERSAVCDAVRRGQRAGRVSCVFESDARGVASSSRNVVRTIRFFFPSGLTRLSAITRRPKYISTTLVTSRWDRIIGRLPTPFGSSSIVSYSHKPATREDDSRTRAHRNVGSPTNTQRRAARPASFLQSREGWTT